MSPNLPYNASFEALGQLLGHYGALGFPAWSLHVRTVAFRHKDDWFNYATAAWMHEGAGSVEKVTLLRENVALIDYARPVTASLSPHELAKSLAYWRCALKIGFGLTFQATIQLHRNSSDFRSNSWPGWWTQLSIEGGQTIHPLPDGPFFDPRERIFGQDVSRLAMQFLGDAKYASHHNPPNDYTLRIPDRRARISALSVQENVLKLGVENPAKLKLFWSVLATPFSGGVFNDVLDVENGHASVELPFAVQRFESWLILEDGYMLDRYEETPHYSTWGAETSLFNSSRRAESKALIDALAGGESDDVEFKPYIRVKQPRDKKAMEILKTVSAFANTGGGDLYIGVNDEAEPIGVETDLNRDYGDQHGDGLARQAAYAKDLRKLINEGAAPTLDVDLRWHDYAHRTILQIRVPQSTARVYLPENGELYRRAGATSKKWRAVDAMPPEPAKPDPLGR